MANTTFNRSFLPSILRRNFDLLSVLITVTRKNLTEKKDCFGSRGLQGSVAIDAILST